MEDDPRVTRLTRFFETLTLDFGCSDRLGVRGRTRAFKTRLTRWRGLPEVRRVFVHMFEQVKKPPFCRHAGRFRTAMTRFLTWISGSA